MLKHLRKQLIIASIYLIIFAAIAAGIYFLGIKPKLPSCSDGMQNQKEAGIDCGGPCLPCFWQIQKPIEKILVQVIETQENYVDLVAQIKNPNNSAGVESLLYKFNLYDADNNLIISKEGSTYILPRQTRYIVEQRVFVESRVFKAELEIGGVDWQRLIDYEEPELLIKYQNIETIEDNKIRLVGTMENRSNYDFDKIDILAILFNQESQIIAAGKTDTRTVLSKQSRYFEISWVFPINGQIEKVEVMAETNVFADDNFMKRYGGEIEKFQEYQTK